MKSVSFAAAAVAASILFSGGQVAALPRKVPHSDVNVDALGGRTFKVAQVHNENVKQTAKGPKALGKAFQKFGVQFPASLRQLLQQILEGEEGGSGGSNATSIIQGEVSTIPALAGSEYLAAVQIGTPPQTLMLDFDTGSSDLWVFSSETAAAEVKNQTLYDIAASSTARKLQNATWSITYGDGSMSAGDVYLETVSIGGVTVVNQAVESAARVSTSFTSNAASSGLLGLAFSSINQVSPTKQNTFFANAMAGLAMPLFTANLKKGAAGNYNFGFIDATEFAGPLSYVDVQTSNGFWEFQGDGFAVGNSSAATVVAAPHTAIADTGTTLLLLPANVTQSYYAQVAGATNSAADGGWIFPCAAALPDLALVIGGGAYRAVVTGDVIHYAPVDTDSLATATTCFGGLQSAAGLPFSIYGDVFLQSQFTVFDAGNTQLGFAPKAGI